MSKYIDKDKVLEYITFGVVGKDITCGELTRAIESIPTIDIVRCKECKHKYVTGTTTQYYVCDFMDTQYDENGYCHHGEREEE